MALTIIHTARPSPVWQETYVRVKKGQRMVVDAQGHGRRIHRIASAGVVPMASPTYPLKKVS